MCVVERQGLQTFPSLRTWQPTLWARLAHWRAGLLLWAQMTNEGISGDAEG